MLLRPTAIGITCAAVLLTASIFVADALSRGEEALIARRYADAVTHLRAALAEEPVERHDRVLLLLARAQHLAGDVEGALTTYARLGRDHPDSELVDKAALQRAEVLAGARRHAEAAAIYREQIERLTGPERKAEVAEIYLGLAADALAGEAAEPARAVQLYDLALDLGLGESRSREIRLLAAEAALRAGDDAGAIARLRPLVDELSVEAGKLRAMLALGRAHRRQGAAVRARGVFHDLAAIAPDSAQAADAEFEIAMTFGVPAPREGELDRAIAALHRFAERHPSHEKAPIVEYLVAESLLACGRSEAGLAALRAFLAEAGEQPFDEVPQARARVGFVLREQGRIDEAIEAWQVYLTAHPAHSEWENVQRAIVEAEIARAERAIEAESYDAARAMLERFAQDHPLDERNPKVLLRIADTYVLEKRWADAVAALESCVRKYPDRDEASQAQLRIGGIYESELFDYQRALTAYRAVKGKWEGTASERLRQLQYKAMHLRTPRTYRSGETAAFTITSRNVPEVRVRVYRLDLETWFRATHMPGSVDRLDIEVIEPDRTFESEVPDYVPYRETVRTVPIGFDAPGAYVVKVDDQEREATTMVLVTDLGLIVKTSREELFAFAQDLKEPRVRSGVRVIVSDGQRILAEGTTDERGAFQWRDAALRDVAELRVFAVDASGSGAGTLDLSGLGYDEGLTSRAYLFSDRPAYRPGETLHVKGIVRDVVDGRYVLPNGAPARLRIVSPSGRTLLERDVEYSDFGSFTVDLPLPAGAEHGEWRVLLERGGGNANLGTGTFRVAEFELPRVLLTLEPVQPVVFRGEQIEGRALARHFYGEPVQDRAIEIVLKRPDGTEVRRHGRTNAEGVVDWSFETLEFAEEAVAVVSASIAEDGVQAQVAVPVVTTGFEPTIATLRDVQVAGQPFEVRITIVDRSGAPLAQAGDVVLLRRAGARGGEVEVARQSFRTGGADGVATVTLRAEQGGQHVVRVVATDRTGQLVTTDHAVVVSAEDDATRLRILADRQRLRVGETLEVTVLNRAGERLALRTIQADGVLDFAAEVVPSGTSTLRIPMTGDHAPNFALALAMIDGTELRTAEQEFLVARELAVEVRAPVEPVSPGAEQEVEVVVRDARGPVEAEVALALVDRSLFELFPDATPEIGSFFFGGRRATEFRTVSSCSWAYRGASRPMSIELVAEELRVREGFETGGPITGYPEEKASAFDSNRWNSAVGLGGGKGTAIGGRRGDIKDRTSSDVLLLDAFDEVREQLADRRHAQPRDGAWFAAVRTDADGRARVTLQMPPSAGEWRLTARAVTVATDVGQSTVDLRTADDLVASVSAPRVLVAGDRTSARVELHNRTREPVDLRVALRAGADERREDVALDAGAARTLPLSIGPVGAGTLELGVAVDGGRAAATRRVDVLPFGVELRDGQAGVLTHGAHFDLALPADRRCSDQQLRIVLVPAGVRGLVAAALAPGYRPRNCRAILPTHLDVAMRGLAASFALDHLDRVGVADRADRTALEATLAGAVTTLLAEQRQDGGVPWIGDRGAELRTTAAALRLFTRAAARGSAPARQAADRAGDWLVTQAASLHENERPAAELALAAAGRGRFEALNTLHRRRASLPLDALGRLALGWRALGRAELAGEVDAVILEKLELPAVADARLVVAVALATRSLLVADPSSARAGVALEWLDAQRTGATWATAEATAEALQTFAVAGGRRRAAAADGVVTVRVGDVEVERVELGADARQVAVDVPTELIRDGGATVELELEGRGEVRYTAVLSGFADGFTAADRRDDLVNVERHYLPAPRRIDDAVVRPGFTCVSGRHETFQNRMTRLPIGAAGRVEISLFVLGEPGDARISPLVVEEPIPAGCVVPRESVTGSYEHLEVLPDRLVFHYRSDVRADSIRYDLQGRFAGTYRVLPTVARGAERPDLVAYGPASTLEVVRRGGAAEDDYRMTPDELLAFGRAAFRSGRLTAAGEQLGALVDGWTLRDEVFREVAQMMLFVAIDAGDAAAIVRWFEQLKDRAPDFVVPFDAIRSVGRAYIDLGEFEAAVLVHRATAEASFLKEARVADTLQSRGELQASVQFLERLLDAYPDLPTMRQSRYGIGQQLAMLAAEIESPFTIEFEEPEVGAEALRRQASETLREFLVWCPEDPLAEEVSFAWVTTAIEAGWIEQALAIAEGALARYAGSPLEDEFLYTAGYARFVLGQPDAALEAVRRVATEEFARAGGGRGPSDNRRHAIYLEGQIHHAAGRVEPALEAYDRVAKDFSDAGEAAEFFRRKELRLPEVTRFGTQEDPRVSVTSRNVESIAIKVYRVDLMRLYLLHRSLDNVRDILLHGIAPSHAAEVAVGGPDDFAERTTAVPLPVDAEGAYLVVARAGDLIASGLVLVSDLRIEAHEQPDVGRVRVHVRRGDAWAADAHVKVVGSGDDRIQSGDTDPRGIFVAADVVGKATVIARLGDGFAFHRGTEVHQPGRVEAAKRGVPAPQQQRSPGKEFDAWENNLQLNEGNRRRQVDWLREQVLEKEQKGVEVQRTR